MCHLVDLTHLLQDRFEGRFDGGAPALASHHVSPLQGAKIVVANLQTSVTQEDIIELFGDVGALKRAKIVGHGQVRVTSIYMMAMMGQ